MRLAQRVTNGSKFPSGVQVDLQENGMMVLTANRVSDLMQLLEISKDSTESFPVTYNNRIINHSQYFLAFMILLETEDLVQLLFSVYLSFIY